MSVVYSGVWRNGSTPQKVFTNADWPSFAAQCELFQQQQFYPVSLSSAGSGSERRWTGVFTFDEKQASRVAAGFSWSDFDGERTKNRSDGFQLNCLESYVEGGETLYAGIWSKADAGGTDKVWVDASWEKMKTTIQTARTKDLRLVDFATHVNSDGDRRWSGVFQPGTGESRVWVGGDLEHLNQNNASFRAQSLQLFRLKSYFDQGRTRYAGIWRESTDSSLLLPNIDFEGLKSKRSELKSQMHLLDLDSRSLVSGTVEGRAGAPTIRVYVMVLHKPDRFSLDTMINNAKAVYAQGSVGVNLDIVKQQDVDEPSLTNVRINECNSAAQFSPQHLSLLQMRGDAGPNDIVVHLVNNLSDSIGLLNGCAQSPPGSPGVVIAAAASGWTMAHELGHILGLEHVSNNRNLMYARTGDIVTSPPAFVRSEVQTILNSPYVQR